jgi:hypothetical protein
MPVRVQKRGTGSKPYKLVDPSGRIVGSSRTLANAQAAARARNGALRGWRPKRRRKR